MIGIFEIFYLSMGAVFSKLPPNINSNYNLSYYLFFFLSDVMIRVVLFVS